MLDKSMKKTGVTSMSASSHENESVFREQVSVTLEHLFACLEDEDEGGALDIDLHDGVLTIATHAGHTFVVSRHAPNRELWLSSPLTGGSHFFYNPKVNDWALSDGRTLTVVLSEEISQSTGAEFRLGSSY
jgi:frataxin